MSDLDNEYLKIVRTIFPSQTETFASRSFSVSIVNIRILEQLIKIFEKIATPGDRATELNLFVSETDE